MPSDFTADLPGPRDDEPGSLRRDILDELADHLGCAAQREGVDGAEPEAARRRVLARFGDPSAIARRLYWDAMREIIMRQRILNGVLILLAVAVIGMFWTSWRLHADNRTLLEESQALNQQMIEQLQALAARPVAAAAPSQPAEWNDLKVKLVWDDEEQTPVEGGGANLKPKSAGTGTMPVSSENTDANGVASFGQVLFGTYELSINTPNLLGKTEEVVVRPGQDKLHIVKCPPGEPTGEVRFSISMEGGGELPEALQSRIRLLCSPMPSNDWSIWTQSVDQLQEPVWVDAQGRVAPAAEADVLNAGFSSAFAGGAYGGAGMAGPGMLGRPGMAGPGMAGPMMGRPVRGDASPGTSLAETDPFFDSLAAAATAMRQVLEEGSASSAGPAAEAPASVRPPGVPDPAFQDSLTLPIGGWDFDVIGAALLDADGQVRAVVQSFLPSGPPPRGSIFEKIMTTGGTTRAQLKPGATQTISCELASGPLQSVQVVAELPPEFRPYRLSLSSAISSRPGDQVELQWQVLQIGDVRSESLISGLKIIAPSDGRRELHPIAWVAVTDEEAEILDAIPLSSKTSALQYGSVARATNGNWIVVASEFVLKAVPAGTERTYLSRERAAECIRSVMSLLDESGLAPGEADPAADGDASVDEAAADEAGGG